MQIGRTIIIILIIFWVIPWIIKKIGPIILKRYVEKKMGGFQQGGFNQFTQQQQQNQEARRREGEVNIKYNSNSKSKPNNSSTNDIEDIDFEEVN